METELWMAKNSHLKAKQIGEALQALAYHDFDFLETAILIRDYDPGPLADEHAVSAAVDEQSEQHLLLHHGVSSESGAEVRDDWCFKCTKQFLSKCLGTFAEDILNAAEKSEKVNKLACKEAAATFVISTLRFLDEHRKERMRTATAAVRSREKISARAEELEQLLRNWGEDDDRVTDFYAEMLGRRFPKMVDRAEALNAIYAKERVPEAIQRYLVEASRCYIFGQYLACLVVCRATIEIALGDFLLRNGKKAELGQLIAEKRDGLSGRIDVAQSLDKWKLKFTLAAARELQYWAGKALHEQAVNPEKCKELFLKARGILGDLYS